ncbi:cadmium-translocating P-type ATPase, partial [Anaerolineae bacterium CFX9]|nr:cadmium-translocating P-type ATPase [Anaerolineae bacterium CFX9]
MTATTKIYTVQGMDCVHCAQEVETGVARLDGVQSVRVDFATSLMHLEGDVPFDVLQARVQALGKSLQTPDEPASARSAEPVRRGGVIGFRDYLLRRGETRLALIGGGLVLLTLALSILGMPESFAAVLYTVGMAITLLPILRQGLNALRINREFNINLLMSIAAIGAIAIGEFLEGATVIFLFAIGEALEGYTADRARDSIRGLMALKPTEAWRLDGDREARVPVESLRIGDRVLVKPGENVPMDGVVLTGLSSVNQAPITGESLPIAKSDGDALYAGTINGHGALTMRVTRLAKDNTLSRIIALVEEAQSVRAPSQRLIDRFAHYYTPAVVVLAGLVAFAPPLLTNAPFYDTPETRGWLYRALSMLVIACPCALVISTPVTIISAITAAARRGVLIKGGAFLEALAQIRAVAFDKTGTLTRGTPQVMSYHAADCAELVNCPVCDDVLALAAAVERRAAHPLAQAVVSAAQAHGVGEVYAPAETVEMLTGRGVRGTVNGRRITIGSHSFFDSEFPHAASLCAEVEAAEAQGQTTLLLADDQRVRGLVTLADAPRDSSREVVRELHDLGLTTIMLTGDNPAAAQAIGAAVGVDDVQAGLLPEHKLDAVRALMTAHGRVAMIGDGVNDTPALAGASVGIAMGGAGSPQALETADIALMGDDLR